MPITNVASAQLALLKTTASQGSNGVKRRERSAMARTKNAIGTTTRFANNEIGVTRLFFNKTTTTETNPTAPALFGSQCRNGIPVGNTRTREFTGAFG